MVNFAFDFPKTGSSGVTSTLTVVDFGGAAGAGAGDGVGNGAPCVSSARTWDPGVPYPASKNLTFVYIPPIRTPIPKARRIKIKNLIGFSGCVILLRSYLN